MRRERSEVMQIAGRDVQVIWSARRKRTVSARFDGPRIVIRAPARAARRELQPVFARLVERVIEREQRHSLRAAAADEGNERLQERAQRLADRYLGRGAVPAFIAEWSHRMTRRFGVCHPSTRVIRISASLAALPDWVLDYLILHELAHLIRPDHSPAFWELVAKYPKWREGRGYLQGYAHGTRGIDGSGEDGF